MENQLEFGTCWLLNSGPVCCLDGNSHPQVSIDNLAVALIYVTGLEDDSILSDMATS